MSVTEEELKAHSKAPRVTPEVLESHIAGVNHFTAGNAAAALGQPSIGPINLLTICVVTMKNGFTVVGHSACASPENFDAEIGFRIAFDDAKRQMWPLLGYSLKDHLAYDGQSFWSQPEGA